MVLAVGFHCLLDDYTPPPPLCIPVHLTTSLLLHPFPLRAHTSGSALRSTCLRTARTASTSHRLYLAVLIGMSSQLNSLGVIKAFADSVGGMLATLNMSWMPLFGLLHAVFFYLHYMFCAMMLSAGVPPVLAAMTLAYSINLFGSISHYASGQAAVFYGSGYMTLPEVFKIGAINGVVALALWAGLGMPVWKLLGWY